MEQVPQKVEIRKSKDWNYLSRLGLSIVFSVIFASILLQSYYFTASVTSIAVMAVISGFLCAFFFRTTRLIIVAAIAMASGAAATALFALIFPGFRMSLQRYVQWLGEHLNGNLSADSQYYAITAIIVTIAAAILCYIVFVGLRTFFIPFTASFVALILIGIYKPNTPTAAILILTFYTVIFCLLSVYNALSKHRIGSNREGTAFIVFIALIGLIVMMVSSFLPKNNHPVQIRWLDELYNRLYYATTTINRNNNDLFYFAYHIKSDNLDGFAYPDDLRVLTVISDKSEYLKYSIKDKYTGFSWIDTDRIRLSFDQYDNEIQKVRMEMNDGIRYLNPGNIKTSDFVYMNHMQVQFERIKADFLFTPAYLESVNPEGGSLSVNSGGIVFISEQRKRGFTYQQVSTSVNYGHPSFAALLRKSKTGLYESYFPDEPDSVHETLVERARTIRKSYLDIPTSLPDRVGELASSLTESATNNYDKVKSIENYLAEEMSYTLRPKQRPMNRDLVDYFLFDSKEGYCTSYASAMTMMVRSLGIPARYCEGYAMPRPTGDPMVFTVTNRQAHAWCEVYFEGFGWIPFEPTSTYRDTFYRNAAYMPEQPQDEFPDESDGASTESGGDVSAEDPSEGDDDERFISPSPLAPKDDPNSIDTPSTIFMKGILVLLLVLIIIVLVRAVYNQRKMKKMLTESRYGNPTKGIVMLYRYYVDCLAVLNLKRLDYETPYEYYHRISKESEFLKRFNLVTEAFVEARYNPQAMLAPLQKDVYLYNTEFQKFLREHLNIAEYAFYHYFKGIV